MRTQFATALIYIYIYVCVCVCVCVTPWTKGLTPPLSHRQGARGRMDGTSQRRLIHDVVIPDLISLAYLRLF